MYKTQCPGSTPSYPKSSSQPLITWPHQVLGSVNLASSIPPTPRLLPPSIRQALGFLHKYLRSFSRHYCRWCSIPFNNQIAALPFGLVLKWSDGTRLEEVTATLIARATGFPVPKIVFYAEHADTPHAPVSILMTRKPGEDLREPKSHERMTDDERERIFAEPQCMLQVMRKWHHIVGKDRICSVSGTAVRSVRIPNHAVGPCETEAEFNNHLFDSLSGHRLVTEQKFKETVEVAGRLQKVQHSIVFTHGDVKHHNIMVLNGHSTGFLDWESAGWSPEYWEFTTPLRFGPREFWWNEWVWGLGGEKYAVELESEKALVPLTVDAWAW